MGRLMPTECAHGRIRDWGDFGDEDGSPPEPCPECDVETDRIRRLADAEQAVIAAADEWKAAKYRMHVNGGEGFKQYVMEVRDAESRLSDAVAALRAAREGSEQ